MLEFPNRSRGIYLKLTTRLDFNNCSVSIRAMDNSVSELYRRNIHGSIRWSFFTHMRYRASNSMRNLHSSPLIMKEMCLKEHCDPQLCSACRLYQLVLCGRAVCAVRRLHQISKEQQPSALVQEGIQCAGQKIHGSSQQGKQLPSSI